MFGIDERAHGAGRPSLSVDAVKMSMYRDRISARFLGRAVVPVADYLDEFDVWMLIQDFMKSLVPVLVHRITRHPTHLQHGALRSHFFLEPSSRHPTHLDHVFVHQKDLVTVDHVVE